MTDATARNKVRLVRDRMETEYVKIVACVVAAFGIHRVIPYHFITKGKSDHQTLFENLSDVSIINMEFFQFSAPAFSAVTQRMFDGVKKEYGLDVLKVVTEYANVYLEDCIGQHDVTSPSKHPVTWYIL